MSLTIKNVEAQYAYSDLGNNLETTITRDIDISINKEAIEQSIVNIVTTPLGSLRYNLSFGSNVRRLLFERITNPLITLLNIEITNALQNWEPRVTDVYTTVEVVESNTISINIQYTIVETEEINTVNIQITKEN